MFGDTGIDRRWRREERRAAAAAAAVAAEKNAEVVRVELITSNLWNLVDRHTLRFFCFQVVGALRKRERRRVIDHVNLHPPSEQMSPGRRIGTEGVSKMSDASALARLAVAR